MANPNPHQRKFRNMTNRSKKELDSNNLTDPFFKTALNSLSAHIAIINENGDILETNRAWHKFADTSQMNGALDSIGINYLTVCDVASGDDAQDARAVAEGIRSVIHGEIEEFLYDYPCHSPQGKHWYYMRAIRMQYDGPGLVIVSHEDITALKLAEEALKRHEKELEDQKQKLEDTNIALKVLLDRRSVDRKDFEQQVLANIKETVFPFIQKLKNTPLKSKEKALVEMIDANLNQIISPFLQKMAALEIFLTPQEMQVASLVKEGKTSKEIADVMTISEATVHFHRKNLRTKLGLKKKQTNLRTYLLSLS